MKVKVTWRNKNPFCPNIEQMGRVAEADIPEDISFADIKEWAKQATPQGYFLKKIEMPDKTYTYKMDGSLIEEEQPNN